MAFGTLDALAGGNRVIVGLGVSGPQIVEGWYGQPWGRPYWRVRDYVAIMRKVFRREAPVAHDGRELQLPYTGPGASGLGKPLRSILHMNPNIPIWLGTRTEAMVKLTGEIADGWLCGTFVPGSMKIYGPWLEEGFRRAGNGKSFANFAIHARVPVTITDDVRAGLRPIKEHTAWYVGGMGHRDKNFHKDAMILLGYREAAETIQELFLAGRRGEAIEAVPDEYCDEFGLVGPEARIRQRYRRWEDSGVTGLRVQTDQEEAIALMADLAGTVATAGRQSGAEVLDGRAAAE